VHCGAGEAIEEERRMGRYAHVIWDWNGTLLDDVALCLDIMNRMLDERGMRRIEPVRYRQIFDFPVQLYYGHLGFDFDSEPFEQLAACYCEQYDARVVECALQNNARRMLERLSERGVSQAILSSQEQQTLGDALRHFRIEHHFTEIVGRSDRHATGKVDTGRALLEGLAAEPERTLLIGDTVHDFEVAAALGVDCILVSHGHHSRDRLEAVHHDVVPSLRTLSKRPELS
jgi:phosphoglycolate phosphatase